MCSWKDRKVNLEVFLVKVIIITPASTGTHKSKSTGCFSGCQIEGSVPDIPSQKCGNWGWESRQLAANRPRSIYQYSSIAPRVSGQNCKFFKSKRDLDTKKTTPNIEVWPEGLGAMLEYRTWPIVEQHLSMLCNWHELYC